MKDARRFYDVEHQAEHAAWLAFRITELQS
jgi:hypothetical protein